MSMLLRVHPPSTKLYTGPLVRRPLDKGKCEGVSELMVDGRIPQNRWPSISKPAPWVLTYGSAHISRRQSTEDI